MWPKAFASDPYSLLTKRKSHYLVEVKARPDRRGFPKSQDKPCPKDHFFAAEGDVGDDVCAIQHQSLAQDLLPSSIGNEDVSSIRPHVLGFIVKM